MGHRVRCKTCLGAPVQGHAEWIGLCLPIGQCNFCRPGVFPTGQKAQCRRQGPAIRSLLSMNLTSVSSTQRKKTELQGVLHRGRAVWLRRFGHAVGSRLVFVLLWRDCYLLLHLRQFLAEGRIDGRFRDGGAKFLACFAPQTETLVDVRHQSE